MSIPNLSLLIAMTIWICIVGLSVWRWGRKGWLSLLSAPIIYPLWFILMSMMILGLGAMP